MMKMARNTSPRTAATVVVKPDANGVGAPKKTVTAAPQKNNPRARDGAAPLLVAEMDESS
jgi:hypothetical protein